MSNSDGRDTLLATLAGVLTPLDPLDLAAAPNCPNCLSPLSAVVGAWFCESCRLVGRSSAEGFEWTVGGPPL